MASVESSDEAIPNNKKMGSIRVGRTIYDKTGKYKAPTYPGFTPIVVLTKSSDYGALGPYVLKNAQGQIMENIWQFSKVYEKVPLSKQKYSRWDETIIWDHPYQLHCVKQFDQVTKKTLMVPNESYWAWRKKGFNNKYPVRYPVGFTKRHNAIVGAIYDPNYSSYENTEDLTKNKEYKFLDYIEARKAIYLPVYCEMAKKQKQFKELKTRLEKGENLLIMEVDGPHQEDLKYYKENHVNVSDNFIEKDTMLVNEHSIQIMLNDKKHPFGHGYCLAMALLDKDKEWNK